MSNLNDTEKRAEIVKALRDFADQVESDPTIPTPNYFTIYSFLHSGQDTQAERFAAVHDFAEAHDRPVTVENENDRKATKHFGPIKLTVHAFADKQNKVSGVVTRAEDPVLIAV